MIRTLVLLVFFLGAIQESKAQRNICSPIGMDMSSLSTELIDVFKTSRSFFEGDEQNGIWDTGEALPKDSNGYVTSIKPGFVARTLFLETLQGNYPTGTYTLLYDGTGEIYLWADAEITSTIDNGGIDNVILFDVDQGQDGVIMEITSTDPADYIRNIRVIRPEDNGLDYTLIYKEETFTPKFKSLLSNYRNLRFLSWMGANWSPIEEWEDRPQLSHAHWETFEGGRGLPLEVSIDLCNELKIEPWYCIPHKASDDYIQSLAEQLANQLDPNLDVYIEYSNEVWNMVFSDNPDLNLEGQYDYAIAQAESDGIMGEFFDKTGYWVAKRSGEIWDIFDGVFSSIERIKKVIPIQVGPDLSTPVILDYVHNGTPMHEIGDVVACAPYFDGHYERMDLENMSLNEFMDSLEMNQFSFDSGPYWAEQTKDLLQSPGYAQSELRLVAYEGGQHLSNSFAPDDTDPVSQLLMAANRDPRMGLLYQKYLDWWNDLTADIMVLYSHMGPYSHFGSWGLLEHMDQDTSTAVKWMATQEWIRANPCVNPNSITEQFGAGFSLFPNPTAQKININTDKLPSDDYSINISDAYGKSWYQFLMSRESGSSWEKDISHLPSGIYFLSISNRKNKYSKRFIKI